MNIKDYTTRTSETAIYPTELPEDADPRLISLCYLVMKFCGEAGEVGNTSGKILRDDGCKLTPERIKSLAGELGDVAWYWAQLCTVLGLDPTVVLQANLDKLRNRAIRGTLRGDGSNR